MRTAMAAVLQRPRSMLSTPFAGCEIPAPLWAAPSGTGKRRRIGPLVLLPAFPGSALSKGEVQHAYARACHRAPARCAFWARPACVRRGLSPRSPCRDAAPRTAAWRAPHHHPRPQATPLMPERNPSVDEVFTAMIAPEAAMGSGSSRPAKTQRASVRQNEGSSRRTRGLTVPPAPASTVGPAHQATRAARGRRQRCSVRPARRPSAVDAAPFRRPGGCRVGLPGGLASAARVDEDRERENTPDLPERFGALNRHRPPSPCGRREG